MTKTTDELIAEKLMGLRRCKVIWAYWSVNPCWQEWKGTEIDRRLAAGGEVPLGFELGENRFSDQAPEYSTDIRLFWDVVERMRKDGFSFTLWQPGDREGIQAVVSFICSKGPCEKHDNFHHNHHGAYDVEAETAPLAVCLAALKALKIGEHS